MDICRGNLWKRHSRLERILEHYPISISGWRPARVQPSVIRRPGCSYCPTQHGSPPMPSEEGFNVPPGFSVSIGIKFQTTFGLGEPYSVCSRVDPRGSENEVYRLLPCLRRCIQEQVVEECGCVDARLPLAKNMTADNMNGLKYCGQLEPLSPECFYEVNPNPPIICLKPLAEASDRIECGKSIQQDMEKRDTLMTTVAAMLHVKMLNTSLSTLSVGGLQVLRWTASMSN